MTAEDLPESLPARGLVQIQRGPRLFEDLSLVVELRTTPASKSGTAAGAKRSGSARQEGRGQLLFAHARLKLHVGRVSFVVEHQGMMRGHQATVPDRKAGAVFQVTQEMYNLAGPVEGTIDSTVIAPDDPLEGVITGWVGRRP